MGIPSALRTPSSREAWLALAVFAACLGFHFRGALVGWQSRNLPGVEYRQAQTAISAFYINQEDNFSLAYPTPVLGKPWSIPLEFPLYQWTVVSVSRVTGLSLTKAGRAVSLACFYLMLPAIYLLLARWHVAPGHRWLVLGVVVTCPLYVFYSRAFLIETMALMFSVWFWVAYERAVAGGQGYAYFDRYYPVQCGISPGGDGLTQSLRALTEPDEVIVVTGQDWNSMTPYYAQRRALMLRGDAEADPAQVDAALAALDGEKLGALAVTGSLAGKDWFIQRMVARGLGSSPLYLWRDVSVFLPAARRTLSLQRLEQQIFSEVRPAPGVELPHGQPLNTWWEVAKLWRSQRGNFDGMTPVPVRYFSTFGLTLERAGGRTDFGAHPVTRLVFALPAGRHVLRTSVLFSPDAYRPDLSDNDATDGVEITLAALSPGDGRHVLDTRVVDPRHHESDRGRKPLRIEFNLPQAGEVELYIGPGPSGRSTRDWVMLGRLVID